MELWFKKNSKCWNNTIIIDAVTVALKVRWNRQKISTSAQNSSDAILVINWSIEIFILNKLMIVLHFYKFCGAWINFLCCNGCYQKTGKCYSNIWNYVSKHVPNIGTIFKHLIDAFTAAFKARWNRQIIFVNVCLIPFVNLSSLLPPPLKKEVNFRNSEIYQKFRTVILSIFNNREIFLHFERWLKKISDFLNDISPSYDSI